MKIKVKYVDFLREQDMRDGFAKMLRDGLADLGEVEFCDNPDYILCSHFGKEYRHYDCTRILVSGENQRPDFNLYDYAVGSDWMTYEDRFLSLQWYAFPRWKELASWRLQSTRCRRKCTGARKNSAIMWYPTMGPTPCGSRCSRL